MCWRDQIKHHPRNISQVVAADSDELASIPQNFLHKVLESVLLAQVGKHIFVWKAADLKSSNFALIPLLQIQNISQVCQSANLKSANRKSANFYE
jgi:hypothetical protein